MSYAVHHHLGSDSAWLAADKCVRVCVYSSNRGGEGSGRVSIVMGPIPGERSVHTLLPDAVSSLLTQMLTSRGFFFLLFLSTVIVDKFGPFLCS